LVDDLAAAKERLAFEETERYFAGAANEATHILEEAELAAKVEQEKQLAIDAANAVKDSPIKIKASFNYDEPLPIRSEVSE